MKASEKIESLNILYQKSFGELKETVRKFIGDYFQEIFDEHPIVESFSWVQYTPYFNDGDECVFQVRADEWDGDMKINNIFEYDFLQEKGIRYVGREERTFKPIYAYPDGGEEEHKQYKAAENMISDFVNHIPEDILKSIYGDHVKITVHRDGSIDTSEYDHD